MYQIREWNKFLIPYEQAVDELKVKFKSIRAGYLKASEYSPIEFLTGRVKKVSSILSKCKVRDIKYENIEREMEDITGIRIMCQLIDDIYSVVELIRNRKDFKIVYEKDYIHDVKESGYRSYHIVIKYPVYTAFGYKEVLAEIQIRTLAMNFWATIEHSLNYKYKNELPLKLQQRLKKTAKLIWELDREMSKIKSEIITSQMEFAVNSDIIREITDSLVILKGQNNTTLVDKYTKKIDDILDFNSNEELIEILIAMKKDILVKI